MITVCAFAKAETLVVNLKLSSHHLLSYTKL